MGQTASGVDPLVSESPVESDPDSDLHDVDRSVEVAGNEARAKPEAVSTATVQSQQNGVWRVFSNAPAEVFATSKAAMSIAGKTDQVLVQAKKSDVASGEMPPLPVERGLFQSGGEKIVEKPHPILAALQDGGARNHPKARRLSFCRKRPAVSSSEPRRTCRTKPSFLKVIRSVPSGLQVYQRRQPPP